MATVLLIEAEESDAEMMQGLFEGAGHQVIRATEGPAGIDLARTMVPDLIMLAVELPGTSGYKACRDLKQDDALQTIPLVITSSTATEDTFAQHRTFKTRADEYLHKPLDRDLLSETVAKYIAIDGEDDDDELLFAPVDDEDGGDEDVLFAEPDLTETEIASGADADDELVELGDGMLDVGDDMGLADMLDDIDVSSEIMEISDDEMLEEVSEVPMSDLVDVVEVSDAPEAPPEPPANVPAPPAPPASVPAPPASVPSPLESSPAPPPSSPPADASIDPGEVATLRARTAELEADNARLTGELDEARATIETLREETGDRSEIDTLETKLKAARETLAQLRFDYVQTVTTISTVLSEKAAELEAYGPVPEADGS